MEDDGICMQCHATEGFSDASAEGVDSGYGSRHDTSSFVWLRQRSAAHGVLCDQCLDRLVESGDLAKYADRRGPLAHLPDTVLGAVFVLGADYGNRFVAAARLMGADCIISGIRPQIASTIVHLGVNLGDVVTKATLADAFSIALRRNGLVVGKLAPVRKQAGE